MAIPLSYNVRNVRQRWRVTLLALGGIALVVAVLVVLLALATGLRIALAATGSPGNAIVVQRGATQELTSGVGRETANVIATDGRVARDASGRPLASPEIVVIATLPRVSDGTEGNVQVRGVSPAAYQVRSNVRVAAGRLPTPGLGEVLVGRQIAARYRGVEIGQSLRIKGRDWPIVGTFEADGSSFESEVWTDVDVMAAVFSRQGGYQSVTLRLADARQLDAWADEVAGDPRLPVDIRGERQFYEDQAGPVGAALLGLDVFVSIVMGVGAVFGAMNTMYAVVAQRTREIATLRALGFSRLSILSSFVVESMFIALVAGVLGCALGWAASAVFPAAATGNVTFSELAFAFRATPGALVAGLVFALVMGLVGGLLPAVRAARLPISRALREA
jgi:putative ABC transport system permease protein